MLACAVKRWEPALDVLCPPCSALPTKEFGDISCHAWSGNKMPYSFAPPGRIDSTQRQFGIRRPAHRTVLSETSVVLREQMSGLRIGVDPRDLLGQPSRSCSLIATSQQPVCGEAGQKRTKYATLLIRGRAVELHEELHAHWLLLAGATPHIARARFPNPARGRTG